MRIYLRKALGKSFGGKFSDGDLEDLIQDSLLRIHAGLGKFQGQCRFTTWATAVAVNCALSELRRRRHGTVSLDEAVEQGHVALAEETAEAAREVELARLRQGIAEALTERQREATLARLSGLPLMEIARRLDTTQGAVYKVLHDARLRLKTYLETECDVSAASFAIPGSP